MPIDDDICEQTLGHVFRDGDASTLYWIRGNEVLYRHYPLKGADPSTFRWYAGSFGKDRRHCYCASHRFAGGNGQTFRALNFTYATDGVSVWTMGGKVKDADAESFVVCDDGVFHLGDGTRVPYGFGKDKARVFYYDFDGKPNWVRKATAASFVSLNDGFFGRDDRFVFCGRTVLPKAKVEHWTRLDRGYSRDNSRIYYYSREIKDVDYDSFEIVPTRPNGVPMAKDKHRYYDTDRVVSESEFMEAFQRYGIRSVVCSVCGGLVNDFRLQVMPNATRCWECEMNRAAVKEE